MRWLTHVALGVDAAAAVIIAGAAISGSAFLTPESTGAILMGAVLGSLLPDLDASESKIKYLKVGRLGPFRLLAEMTHQRLGNRGLTHSLLGTVLVLALLATVGAVFGAWFTTGLGLGYCAHLAGDSVTVMGYSLALPAPAEVSLAAARFAPRDRIRDGGSRVCLSRFAVVGFAR